MMVNPNNIKEMADALGDILETPVSEKIVRLVPENMRARLASLRYQWTQGKEVFPEITKILDDAKSLLKPRKMSPKTEAYLKMKFNK